MKKLELRFVKISAVRAKYVVIAIGNQNGDIYRLIGVDSQADPAILLKVLQRLSSTEESSNDAHLCEKYHNILSRRGVTPVQAGGSMRTTALRLSASRAIAPSYRA